MDTVTKKYERFGGIPLYCLVKEDHVSERRLQTLITNVQWKDIRNVNHLDFLERTHMIFHRHTTSDDYKHYEMQFATDSIAEEVHKVLKEEQEGYQSALFR